MSIREGIRTAMRIREERRAQLRAALAEGPEALVRWARRELELEEGDPAPKGEPELRIRPIHTKSDHAAALAEVERLAALDPKRGTPECDSLEVLSILVERYEKEQFPIDPRTPIEAIEFAMDRLGLRQIDMVPCIGSRARVSEILSSKRELTLPMIRALHAKLDIPVASLVGSGANKRTKRVRRRVRP